jgi:hypothetical protein
LNLSIQIIRKRKEDLTLITQTLKQKIMSRFISGSELNHEITKLISKAYGSLIFISPYIKLHERLKYELKNKMNKEEIELTIVFGKNENDLSKSLSLEEIDFFKEFPNLKIKFEKRLHAKYYANESTSILTSMNLYDYSINNNIEFGVISENKSSLLGSDNLDTQSIDFFLNVIEGAETIFEQVATFEKSFGGLKKKYTGIEIVEDNIAQFYKKRNAGRRPDSSSSDKASTGYCIRTGAKIDFDPKLPFSEKSYASWLKFKNKQYPEKYCHFSGEGSNGETSFERPILRKNWKVAMGR